MKFRVGLTSKLVGIMVLVAAAVAGVVSWQAGNIIRDQLSSQFKSEGEAIAIALASTLSSNTEDTLKDSLISIKGQIDASKAISNVAYIFVQGADKTVLVSTQKSALKPAEANFVKSGEWPAADRVKVANDLDVEVPAAGSAPPEQAKRVRAMDVAAPIANASLGLVHVGMNQNWIDEQVKALFGQAAGLGLIAAIVGVIIGVLWVFPVARRIRRMTDVAHRIAAGDLSQSEVAAGSSDEVGQMAEAFNRMLHSLRELAAAADRVAKGDLTVRLAMEGQVARAFNGMVEGQQGVVKQISATSASLAGAAAEMYASSQEQEASATQQSSSVEEVSRTMQSLLEAAAHISDSARGVLGNAERTRETTETTAKKITELSVHTNRITEILEVIRDIADRSDLLALNASLEGTRAGEAGRGFSLVASEMRRLAERVTASVQDIKALVSDVRASSSSTVMATEEGRKLAEGTTESARQITMVTQQQRTGTEQVSQSMKDISTMLTQSASATRQQRALAEDLKHQADRLAEVVGRFTVGAQERMVAPEDGAPSVHAPGVRATLQ
jgi:methyl-accepting chemotaxis protein